MEPGSRIGADAFAWAVAHAAALHRIPCDRGLVARQFPPPYDLRKLIEALQALGFETDLATAQPARIDDQPLPCFAIVQAGEDGAIDAALRLILQCDARRILVFDPGAAAPSALPRGEFLGTASGCYLRFAPRAPAIADPERSEAVRAFGFRSFLPELLKHKTIWRDIIASALAIQLMALATPVFTQVIVDKVIVHRTQSTLAVLGTALGLFALFTAALSWVRQYLVLHTGNRVDAVLGARVFTHLLGLPPRYFEQRPTGVVIARLQSVETVREFIASAAVTLILDLPFMLLFLAVMLRYSPPLTALSTVLLALIVAMSLVVAPAFRRRLDAQFLAGARNQAFVTEHIAGMETVKSLQFEPLLRERYGSQLADLLHASFRTRTLANTYDTLANLLEQAMSLGILCYGAHLVMTTVEFTVGMLVAFQMFASRLSQPLLRLVGLWQHFQQAHIALARLGDVLNVPTEPYSVVPLREHRGPGLIVIRDLAFRYGEHLPFLYRGLSFALKPGRVVALIGASGAGKSTLAKILQGFYQPSEGSIAIDGRDIRHFAANELRQYFGVVPQETVLFSGSVYDNLLLANPHASFEQIVAACRRAEIHDTIEKLPQGYRSLLGERGTGLSGGQRQRLAIARALLKGPRVLVFDEATSSVDPDTAQQLARTINQLKGKVTVLFIAHHLPRGLLVDEVVKLGMGEDRHFEVITPETERHA